MSNTNNVTSGMKLSAEITSQEGSYHHQQDDLLNKGYMSIQRSLLGIYSKLS